MSNVSENLKMIFSKMEDFVSTKTVIGEPVQLGNVTIIPLVDVSFGMGTGITDQNEKGDTAAKGMGGGAIGAKMTPSAMLVITDGTVQVVNIKQQEGVSKLIDMVPGILQKFNLTSLFNNKEEENEESGEK